MPGEARKASKTPLGFKTSFTYMNSSCQGTDIAVSNGEEDDTAWCPGHS
jgi:hypothetical protein